MKEIEFKRKKFLLPILSLVIISITIIASINSYITVSIFKTYMEEHIEQTKEEYTQKHKSRVYEEVHFVNDSIKFEITKIENRVKDSLKEKIQIALEITMFTYNTYKNTHNKEEIKKKISEALSAIKFNQSRSYYFMYDNKTKVIFGHPMKKFIDKDMTTFKDVRGRSLMETDSEILKNEKIGFNKIYFNKPNNQKEEFPKITCISKFEPLDLIIGIGEYLDVIEQQTKDYVLSRFSQIKYNEKDKYLVKREVYIIQETFYQTLYNLPLRKIFSSNLINRS